MTQLENDFKIVWVEVGRPIPGYAIRNFKLTNKMHGSVKQYLFTDSSKSLHFMRTLAESEIPKSAKTKEFLEIRKEWNFRQQYFWLGTTKRFFHLYDLMTYLNLQNVVHLETDSILLETKPLREFFGNQSYVDMAYPLQAHKLGCASILLLRSSEILGTFLDYIIANWKRDNVNDMTLLGTYLPRRGVMALPTWPTSRSVNYFYDAVTIGKYFQGSDARNCKFPLSQRGLMEYQEGSIYENIGSLNYSWITKSINKNISIEIEIDDNKAKLVNLHLHSKHISKSILFMKIIIKLGFSENKSFIWRAGLFDWLVFFERTVSFFNRRILRNNKYEEKSLR